MLVVSLECVAIAVSLFDTSVATAVETFVVVARAVISATP